MKNILLTFSILIFLESKQLMAKEILYKNALEISVNEVQPIIEKNGAFFIHIKENSQWLQNSIKVKNIVNIHEGLFEFKYPKLTFNQYKKDESFVIFSKNESDSIVFVTKLQALGFTNVMYLKDGYKQWSEISRAFRGIKVFSMFSND